VLAAIDFTTIEVWTNGGLVTYYVLFVMEIKSCRVHFAGCTTTRDKAWMNQVARNISGVGRSLTTVKFLSRLCDDVFDSNRNAALAMALVCGFHQAE